MIIFTYLIVVDHKQRSSAVDIGQNRQKTLASEQKYEAEQRKNAVRSLIRLSHKPSFFLSLDLRTRP